MTRWISIFLHFLVSLIRTRRDLAFENLLLRQQLAVLKEKGAHLEDLAKIDEKSFISM
jgi:hypothetical protein